MTNKNLGNSNCSFPKENERFFFLLFPVFLWPCAKNNKSSGERKRVGNGRRRHIWERNWKKSFFFGGQILRHRHFSLFLAALWKLLKAQYLFIFCPFLKGEDWKGSHKITCFLRIFVCKGSAHSLLPLPKSLRHHSPPFCSQQECPFARRGESWETEVWELHKNAGGGREEEEGPLDWTKQLFGRGREGGGSLRICQKGGIRIVGGKGGEARRPRRFEKRTGRNFSHFLQRVLFACHEWPICFPMQIAKSPSILLKCYSLFFAENISHLRMKTLLVARLP